MLKWCLNLPTLLFNKFRRLLRLELLSSLLDKFLQGTPNRIAHLMRVLTQRVNTPTLFNCGSEIPAEGRVTLVLYILIMESFRYL